MPEFTLRPATPADVPTVLELVVALAEYEQLTHAVVGSAEALEEHLFGSKPYIEVILAECAGQAVGLALFFHSYSTVETQPGIYLEDLFVLPEFRRTGIGKAMLSYLAQLVMSRGGGCLEWSVLDWNEPAIAFYRRMGAIIPETSRICRLTGNALTQLAGKATSTSVRATVPDDMPMLVRLLQAQAEFNQRSPDFTGKIKLLKKHLFGSQTWAEVAVAEQARQSVGLTVFFHNYSTFLTKPGLFLDNLFVLPDLQHQSITQSLLTYVAQLAVSRDCGRVEWLVDISNKSAIAFYEYLGASILPDWRVCRVTGDALTQLAAITPVANLN